MSAAKRLSAEERCDAAFQALWQSTVAANALRPSYAMAKQWYEAGFLKASTRAKPTPAAKPAARKKRAPRQTDIEDDNPKAGVSSVPEPGEQLPGVLK